MRAIAITVPDDLALGGMLVPGQTVDVFVTAVVNINDPTGKYVVDRSTKITYQDVVILARTGSFYVIRATLPVAEELAHLQATGSATFSFALRPGGGRADHGRQRPRRDHQPHHREVRPALPGGDLAGRPRQPLTRRRPRRHARSERVARARPASPAASPRHPREASTAP